MDGNQDKFVDELLDAGLAQRRSVEPRLGIEQRVLARLRTEERSAGWRAWPWRLAAGLAVAGMIGALVFVASRRQRVPGPPSIAGVESSGSTAPAASIRSKASEPGSKAAGSQRPATRRAPMGNSLAVLTSLPARNEPRGEVFPTPAPLSDQEKLLLAYLRLAPAPNALNFDKGEDVSGEIEIKPLEEIPPLAAEPGKPGNENGP